jgi:hypothetical protein
MGDSNNNKSVTVCCTVFIPLSFKALKQECDKHSVTSLNKSRIFGDIEVFPQQQHKELKLTRW